VNTGRYSQCHIGLRILHCHLTLYLLSSISPSQRHNAGGACSTFRPGTMQSTVDLRFQTTESRLRGLQNALPGSISKIPLRSCTKRVDHGIWVQYPLDRVSFRDRASSLILAKLSAEILVSSRRFLGPQSCRYNDIFQVSPIPEPVIIPRKYGTKLRSWLTREWRRCRYQTDGYCTREGLTTSPMRLTQLTTKTVSCAHKEDPRVLTTTQTCLQQHWSRRSSPGLLQTITS
jgi:hypothetical protein